MTDDHMTSPISWTLSFVGQMSEDHFKQVLAEVSGSNGYKRDFARCRSFAPLLGSEASASHAHQFLASLSYLYDRGREWTAADRDPREALEEFLEITGMLPPGEERRDVVYSRTLLLIGENPEAERIRKLHWLRTGILENPINFSSFAELRPRFAPDRGRIEELIPMVIVQLATQNDRGEDNSLTFQLTENGLKRFRKLLDDIDLKLQAIRADKQLASMLHPLDDPEDEIDPS